MVVEPVLTVMTLNHKFLHLFCLMRFLAVTVTVKETLVVLVLLIIVVLLVLKLTREGHP